jgi:S-adenosylmethionine decarboxylase
LNALGRHLLLELFDCDTDAINNLDSVKGALVEAAKRAQATIVDVVFHEFNPFGISGVVVIAESHLWRCAPAGRGGQLPGRAVRG